MPRLSDPWFEAQFCRKTTAQGFELADELEGADGVQFWCPCGYGKPEFPLDGGRPHAIIVTFSNPRGCDPAPADAGSRSAGGGPSRWTMRGTGIHDLTLEPSIAVGGGCWHGYVTNGEVVG